MPRSEFTFSTSIWFACAISSRVFSIRSSMDISALDTACLDILNERAILILGRPLRLSLQNSNCLSFKGRNISQYMYVDYLKIMVCCAHESKLFKMEAELDIIISKVGIWSLNLNI